MGVPNRYQLKPCLFCGDDDCAQELYPRNFRDEDLDAAVFSARRVTEHFHYRMVRCSRTGLVWSREVLPDEVLARLYADSKVTFSAYADIIRRDYWRPLERHARGMRKDAALEIGCSSGFFLEELRAQGFADVRGCEPSLEAKALAAPAVREGIHTGFFTDAVYPDASFDLICSFQTLDHLGDPLAILETCRRKLRPGGLLYLIVHNTDGLQAKIFGEKSPIVDVEHIYLFNPATLEKAVAKAGFQAERVFPIVNSYPLEYWIRHAPIPAKAAALAFAKATGLAGLRLPIRPGNIGILARKP